MLNLLWVFLGGGLGSICRYSCARFVETADGGIPYGTLLANALSSLLLGYLISLNLKNALPPSQQLLLMTGFCGGFSTFSTFSAEVYQLLEAGEWGTAFIYLTMSLLIGLVAIFLGLKLGT